MRKRIIRSLTATVLITSIMGMTVLADEVTDIKNQQNSLAPEKQNVEDELAFLLTQMDELELSMAQKNDEIEQPPRGGLSLRRHRLHLRDHGVDGLLQGQDPAQRAVHALLLRPALPHHGRGLPGGLRRSINKKAPTNAAVT